MPTTEENREHFIVRTEYIVREHSGVTTYLDDFVSFDPEAKPAVDTFNQAMNQIAAQLKERGMKPIGQQLPHLALDRESAIHWARRFSSTDPQESCVPYCRAVDRALAPFMQAYEDAYQGLKMYVKSRVET